MTFNVTDINLYSPEISGFGNDTIKVTEQYITKNAVPWLPVMGEFHYSRFRKDEWENELIKMKNCGIEIIASYVFWIHHEENEGIFNWTENNDLREFIALCQKHSLYFFLRPGPWAHGECRNGGFPDWLLEKCNGDTRCLNEPYISYVKRFFNEIAKQIEGFTNIIGIQVENEFVHNPDYLLKLKKIILDCGMNAPIFTATAWGYNPQIPYKELLPVYGAYPEAPWEQHTKKLSPNAHYFFNFGRNDFTIGNDSMQNISSDQKEPEIKPCATPFLTCELGGGNQVTYHRRPIIKAKDVSSLAYTLLGGGCNLLGYYVFHGGANPIIGNKTFQESRKTGYANDYPIISYDFQSPIGECGQLRESYKLLSELHSFTKSFGNILCAMPSFLPDELPKSLDDNDTLRCALRTNGKAGFIFINNYQRLQKLKCHKDINIKVKLLAETITLSGINVIENSCFILPVNLTIGDKLLKYALAQPLSIEDNVWTFLKIDGMEPHFCFEDCEFTLTDKGYTLGDIKLRLVKPQSHKLSIGKKIEAVLSENAIDFHYFEYLNIADNTKEFTLKWEEDFEYLAIDCIGNVAHAYYNKELIADWFCNATSWVIDVKSLKQKELIIKIQPLLKDDDIYFESDIDREKVELNVSGFYKSQEINV